MKSPTDEDLQFLRDIRGRFEDSKPNQRREWMCITLFSVVFPAFFLVAFFFDREHGHWIFVAAALLSLFFIFFVWRDRGLTYEFNGIEIIEMRGGRVRNTMAISNIIETDVNISPNQLILKSSNSRMTVRILPSLNEVIQKKGAEMMAKQSLEERERYDQVQQQMISRLKWTNWIGIIAIVLVMSLIGLVMIWLRRKHIIHEPRLRLPLVVW